MLRSRFLAALSTASAVWGSESLAAGARTAELARVRLGYTGNVCEAVTVTAPNSLAFRNQRLAPRLVGFSSEDALLAALDAGTIDAASMKLPSLLKPLENGSRLRVAAGLHSGCMNVLARNVFAFNTPADLKGQTIGTDRLNGPAMHLFMALLRKAGLDPQRDIVWRGYSADGFDSALRAHIVNCVAVSDPVGYELQTAHRVEPFLDTAGGGFSCGTDIATAHHCFLAIAGGLVEGRPALAAALTRAFLDGSAAFGDGLESAQLDALYGPFRAGRGETTGMLASYDWRASTDFVVEQLELTARDFQRAGLLRAQTDPMALALRAFADLQDA